MHSRGVVKTTWLVSVWLFGPSNQKNPFFVIIRIFCTFRNLVNSAYLQCIVWEDNKCRQQNIIGCPKLFKSKNCYESHQNLWGRILNQDQVLKNGSPNLENSKHRMAIRAHFLIVKNFWLWKLIILNKSIISPTSFIK